MTEIKKYLEGNNWRENILPWILGMTGALAFSLTLPTARLLGRDQVIYSNSMHSFLFLIVGSFFYVKAEKGLEKDKRRRMTALVLSFLFSLFLVAGKELEAVENFNVTRLSHYPILFFCTIFFRPFLEAGWQLIDAGVRNGRKERAEGEREKKSHWLRNTLLLLLCWLPVFLAFYPGAFVYDALEEFTQADTGSYTTHHPLIHVLLLGKSVVLGEKLFGSYNVGIAFYTILQMSVMAVVLSYTLEYVRGKIKHPLAELIGLLFYGLFPVIPMYAVCSAKDTYFTVFLLLTLVKLLQLYENEQGIFQHKKDLLVFIISATLMMLFRNNGIYAYVVWFFIMVAVCLLSRNKKWNAKLKYLLLLLLPLVLSYFLNFGMKEGLQAEKGGSQEIMTVPIQQLARVYHYAPETFSEEEKVILYEILPKEELHLYTPRISDLLKSKFNNEAFRKEPEKYLSLWVKIGLRKPLIYVNGWLMTSYGYWYPDAVNNVYGGTARHTIVYEDSSYFGFETEPPGVRDSKLPLLEKVYRKISLDLFQQRLPGISMLFSPGFLFWYFSFCMGYYVWKREGKLLLSFLLLLLVWMTVLLGPTYLVRYVLILWLAAPLFVSGMKICYTSGKKGI